MDEARRPSSCAPSRATRATTCSRKATGAPLRRRPSAIRESSAADAWSSSLLDRRGVLVDRRGAGSVPMRICEWRQAHQHAERVGEGSSPRISSSPVSIRLKVLEVSTPSASSISRRQNLAHAALERQPPVAARATRACGRCPWCRDRAGGRPRRRAAARTGSRDRRRDPGCTRGTGGRGSAAPAAAAKPPGQRLETPEMLDPLRVAQRVEADPRRPALVAVAQLMLGEAWRVRRGRRRARPDLRVTSRGDKAR